MLNTASKEALAQKNGHVFILLSMSKLAGSHIEMDKKQHTPEDCIEFIRGFQDTLPDSKLKFTVLYTDGLYENAIHPALDVHTKVVNQMKRHSKKFKERLVEEGLEAELVSWNQLILNADGNWESEFSKVSNKFRNNKELLAAVHVDMKPVTDKNQPDFELKAHEQFVLEELLVMEKIRRREIITPQTVEQPDFSIIAYAGTPFASDMLAIESNRRILNGRRDALDKNREYASYQADITHPDNPVLYQTLHQEALNPVPVKARTETTDKRDNSRFLRVASYAAIFTGLLLANRDSVTTLSNGNATLPETTLSGNIGHWNGADHESTVVFGESGDIQSARITQGQVTTVFSDFKKQEASILYPNGNIRKPVTRDDGYQMWSQSEKIRNDAKQIKDFAHRRI